MATENDAVDDDDSSVRKLAFVFVALLVVVSLSSFIFYSTMRSRCIGIANGYFKAIETSYQTGEYFIDESFPDNKFEIGIYKVNVSKKRIGGLNAPVVLRIEIKDKFFMITHHSSELKLIPVMGKDKKEEENEN